jgi:hypothetical protein
MKSLFIPVLVAWVLALAGCRSPARGMGVIHLGDTPPIVAAELGRPDRQAQRPGVRSPDTVWIYGNGRTQPPVATGWSEVLVSGTSDPNGQVIRPAVTREVYRPAGRQEMHVIFTNGRVSSVEYTSN